MGLSIQQILAAQRAAVAATRKVVTPPPARAEHGNSVAEIVERQRAIVAAQKAASGMNPLLSREQKAIIESVREKYNKFIAKLDAELGGAELFMPKPGEPIFSPNVPGNTEVTIETHDGDSAANGISVGDEMGGQVTFSARPAGLDVFTKAMLAGAEEAVSEQKVQADEATVPETEQTTDIDTGVEG